MIPTLLLSLFGAGIPKWLAGPLKYLVDAALIVALLGGLYFWIHHSGVKAGEAKILAKVEKAHAVTIQQRDADTKAAQATTDQIGATTARTNQGVTDYVATKIQEMHNAIAAVPPAAAGGPVPAAPVDSMRSTLNDLAERAGRSADAADAEP